MRNKALLIEGRDNVATALTDLRAGEEVAFDREGVPERVTVAQDIPFGHKFATADIAAGALVIKYGEPIGDATRAILRGEHVHVHNTESRRGRGDRERGGNVHEVQGVRPA